MTDVRGSGPSGDARPGRLRLTYSNVVATVALFVALGGSAIAVSKIDGRDIRDRSVSGDKLKRDDVTGKEVDEFSLEGLVPYCFPGSVHAFTRIVASATFPSSFTSNSTYVDPGLTFHCDAKGKVTARRVSAGVYHVRFKPDIGALAFGNGEGNNLISTRVVDDEIIGKPVFRIEVRDPTAVSSPPADIPFSLLVP